MRITGHRLRARHVRRQDRVGDDALPVDQVDQALLVDREVHGLTDRDVVERPERAVEPEILCAQGRPAQEERPVAGVGPHALVLGGWNAREIELAALVLEPGELRADADRLLDAVEIRAPGTKIIRIPREPEPLPVCPLLQDERPRADGVAGEIVVPDALDRLPVDDGGEHHGELVEEERIDLRQAEFQAVRRQRADAAHLGRLSGDVILGTLDAVEELRSLRMDRRLQQPLHGVLDVRRGERAPGAEADVVPQREGHEPSVVAHGPRLGELGHDRGPRVVVDERVEQHLLDRPRDGVVAARRVEGAWILGRGAAQHPTRPRRPAAVRLPRRRGVERHGTRRDQHQRGERHAPHARRSASRSMRP